MTINLNSVYYVAFGVITILAFYMITQFIGVKRLSEGTKAMSELAASIRSGSKVFTKVMFRIILIVAAILAAIIAFTIEFGAGWSFLLGLAMTTISNIVGMSVATYTNVRASATAKKGVEDGLTDPQTCARTVNVTIKGSQICGLIVHSTSLLGLVIATMLSQDIPLIPNEHGIIPLVARLTAYSIGWSIVAMFCRVAGGIFTKAADIGADLIGKVFMHFKEDDPRNPAVKADFVGDNVNDIAANQADLGESHTATPVTTMVTAVTLFANGNNPALLTAAIAYPFMLSLGGLISSAVGLFYASHAKESDKPEKQINASMYIAAAGTMIASLVISYFVFGKIDVPADFKLGWISPFLSTVCGVISGVAVGLIAEHFTGLDGKWAKSVSEMAKRGSALCASQSQAAGWISCFPEMLVVGIFSYISAAIAGPYGRAVMALGMLAFVAQAIGVDAFGPISDNAGGIAESCGLDPRVRVITDKNDSAGNTTAAIGKGFAISSAFAVVVSQTQTYVRAYGGNSLDILDLRVAAGLGIGAGLAALFCGLLAYYTLIAADEMAAECRRQFADPDVVSGKKLPDSDRCIHISTVNGLKKMTWPVAIAVGSTLIVGFVGGPEMLGGMLVGATYVGVPLAIFFSNAGGLADNAKKRFEAGLVKGLEEGTPEYDAAHDSAVVGDTIGDWMKDVVAVSIDIFMKIMGTLALMLAPLFAAYHILPF